LRALAVLLIAALGVLKVQGAGPDAAANPPYLIAPEPTWAEPAELPLDAVVPDGETSDGIFYLLTEEQILAEPRAEYGQFARRILNESGVQSGSEIHIEVDPSYQKLVLHRVDVLREGQWTNRLDPSVISVLQREADMERYMLDGSYTVVIRLPDIRPGDVIRYSFTTEGANPVMDGHFFTSFSAGWNQPCARFRQRIWLPPGRWIEVRNHNTELAPKIVETEHGTLYEWQAENLPATVAEQDLPYWEDVYPWIEVGDMKGWSEVVDWALPLYDFGQPLSPELEEKIAGWKGVASPEAQVARVLRFVQDEIRYFGVETGEHSHKPRPPAEVFAKRFGDCKEKVLLFCVILRHLGISADPVLVNMDWGRGIDGMLPSPGAFDHVIARVVLDGKPWFLDPTQTHQRGPLEDLARNDYGLGLIVRAGENALVDVRSPEDSGTRNEVEEIIELPGTRNESAGVLKVHTTLRGQSAERARERFAATSRRELQENYRNYYAEAFPSIEVAAPLRNHDDEAGNVFEIWEEYRIPNIWKPGDAENKVSVAFYPQEVTGYLRKPATSGRKRNYALTHPVNVSLRTIIKPPQKWGITPCDFRERNQYFDVSYKVAEDRGAVVISSDYRSLSDHVPAAGIKEYRAAVDRVLENAGYELHYTHPLPSADSLPHWLHLWPLALAMAGSFCVSLAGVLLIWFLGSRGPLPPCLPGERHLAGLGGWLILVGIQTVARPFLAMFTVGSSVLPFIQNAGLWQHFTSPGGSFYSPLWLPVFLFEMTANTALIVFGLLAVILYFSRRRQFPSVMIAIMAAMAAVVLIDAAAIACIPKAGLPEDMQKELVRGQTETGRAIITAMIWIPYFLISRRVRATFRR